MSEYALRRSSYDASRYNGIEIGKSALTGLAEGKNFEAGKIFKSASKNNLITAFLERITEIKQPPRASKKTDAAGASPASPARQARQAVAIVNNLRGRLKADARPLLNTTISSDGNGSFTYTATVDGKKFIEVSGIPALSPDVAGALLGELTEKTTRALLPQLSITRTNERLDENAIRDTIKEQLAKDILTGTLDNINEALTGLTRGEWSQRRNGAIRSIKWEGPGLPRLTYANGAFTLGGKEIMRSAWPAAEAANGRTRSASGDDSSLVSLSLASRTSSGSETATTLPPSSRDGSLTPVSVSVSGSDDAIESDDEAPPPPPPLSDLEEMDDGVPPPPDDLPEDVPPPPPQYDASTEHLLGMIELIHDGKAPGQYRDDLLAEIKTLKTDYENEESASGSDAADELFEARFEALFELVRVNDVKLPEGVIDSLNALWAPVAPPLAVSRHTA